MSKSSEKFMQVRAEEAARMEDELKDNEYREHVYMRGLTEKQPGETAHKSKDNGRSNEDRR